jgi:chemotaxis protein MotA
MIVFIGSVIVMIAVLGGFVMAGGKIGALMHISELVIIAGSALGALIVMSPKKVLIDTGRALLQTLKGRPYGRAVYEDLFKTLYELFLVGRRDGLMAVEDHISHPDNSSILSKYPSFLKHKRAVEFLRGALQPVVDGRVKPEQIRRLLDTELAAFEVEHHAPVNVMSKMADSLPGFGIVAAVLGIVVTMGAINGPVDVIGQKVASALLGTFLGVLLCYGFATPLATNLEFIAYAEMEYLKCIGNAVVEFSNGMAPIMAVEVARRGLSSELRPSEDEMVTMLKSLTSQPQQA